MLIIIHKSVAVVITIIQIPPSIPVSNNGTYKQNTEQTKQTPKIDFKRLVLVVFYSSTTYMYKVFIHILFYQSIYEMKLVKRKEHQITKSVSLAGVFPYQKSFFFTCGPEESKRVIA